jgi:hypothetical protein
MVNYYLVDTNIIIAYINKESNLLTEFIDNPDNRFYYTDTVKREVNTPIPDIFKFYESGISRNKIASIIQQIGTTIHLTTQQIAKFRNDLTIILEAGYVCYDITPLGDYTEPFLLTNNLKLYQKFISDPRCRTQLEHLIDLNGLEHLIEIVRPTDVIPHYI